MSVQVTKDEIHDSRVYVRFIDILYAVVLGQSFVLMSSRYNVWSGGWASSLPQIATILLAYALVITSWVGYHRSVKAYPILNPCRFLLDIFLLFFYYFAFASAGDFALFTRLFAVVFIAYTLWDVLRLVEYGKRLAPRAKDKSELEKRAAVSAVFLMAFLMVSMAYSYASSDAFMGGALFIIMILLLSGYRFVKWKFPTRVAVKVQSRTNNSACS